MNSTARALAQASFAMEGTLPFLSSRRFWVVSLSSVLVLFSALAIVYAKDINRRQFIELQRLEHERDNFHVEWGKLLLEESSWSTARVQGIARAQLNMQAPMKTQMIIIGR